MLVRLVRAGARALVSWVLRCALWLARRAVHFDSVELEPWSGTVRVRGARVREDVLRRVGLGLVLRGSLGTLTLRIPWRRLRSRPVVLELDRLFAALYRVAYGKRAPEPVGVERAPTPAVSAAYS